MTQAKQKVQCYITRERTGKQQVLVFEHIDFPEAGVQVPAGTIDPGEDPERAALREAWEESGVEGLHVRRYLGAFRWWQADRHEEHERHVFHLITSLPLPDAWEHTVSAGEDDTGLRFRYRWLDTDVATSVLSGDQGIYLQYL